MAGQRRIELRIGPLGIVERGGIHLAHEKRMAANRALAEDDQAARQDVRALDGDGDRRRHVALADVIFRAEHDGLAAVHVHRVVRDLAAQLGAVVFQNRRRHRRLLALVDGTRCHRNRGVHHIGVAGNARERFADALELRDRLVELPANPRVSAGCIGSRLAAAGGSRRQSNGAADGQQFHQHLPSFAGHFGTSDDGI